MQILGVRWDCGDFVTIPGRCWSLPPDIPQDTTPLHGHTPDLGPERHAGEARVSRTDTPILHVTSLSCCFAPLISPQLPAGTPPPPPPAGFAFHRLTALSKHPAICPSQPAVRLCTHCSAARPRQAGRSCCAEHTRVLVQSSASHPTATTWQATVFSLLSLRAEEADAEAKPLIQGTTFRVVPPTPPGSSQP